MQILHDLSAVVHVHSTLSDGTATVAELLEAARDSGAGALLLTDHDTLAARRRGWGGRHDGVALIVGTEVSPRGGHYLAFGVSGEIAHAGLAADEIAAAVREAGGVGFAAHPFSEGGRMLLPAVTRRIVLPHGWPVERTGSCDGIELWSVTTDAAESWRTPAAALRWLRDPVAATADGPPASALRAWDALSVQRRVPALGGLDGHAPGVRIRGKVRGPLSHARTFGLLRTHLLLERPLTGSPADDEAVVVEALRAGSMWLARVCVAPADGARYWADLEDGSVVPMGGEARLGSTPSGAAANETTATRTSGRAGDPPDGAADDVAATASRRAPRAVLRVRLPRAAELRVLRDGEPCAVADGAGLDLPLDRPGAYRVEARVGGAMWLLSNPIHLR